MNDPIFTIKMLDKELRKCKTVAQVRALYLRCKPEPAGSVNSNYDPSRWAQKLSKREKELK
jgi:hypothetical protein